MQFASWLNDFATVFSLIGVPILGFFHVKYATAISTAVNTALVGLSNANAALHSSAQTAAASAQSAAIQAGNAASSKGA